MSARGADGGHAVRIKWSFPEYQLFAGFILNRFQLIDGSSDCEANNQNYQPLSTQMAIKRH
jgi:hypothetical protein